MHSKYLFTILVILVLSGCHNPPPAFPDGQVEGYRPIYATDSDNEVQLQGSKSIVNPGQIYVKGDLLLINEIGEGLHIIDNSDPAAPVNRGFLKIRGSENMSLKDGILYINQFNSLLVIDVNDIQNFSILATHEGVLDNSPYELPVPPVNGYYFECVDPAKGQVIGWQLTTVNSPRCYR